MCSVIVLVGITQIVVSYFDLQLTYYRNMVYFGTLLGLLPTLEALDTPDVAKISTDQAN